MLRAIPIAAPAALLLLGCAEPGGAPPASTAAVAAASPPAAAAAPATAGTRFDGRYSGPSNLTLSRGRACGAQTGQRTVTVRNGQARMLYDTMLNRTAAGPVRPDGSVTMIDEGGLNVRVTGRFDDGRFQGELNTVQCVRALDLRRVGR